MSSNVPVMNESVQYMIHFIHLLFTDSFITRTFEPTNDQLPISLTS